MVNHAALWMLCEKDQNKSDSPQQQDRETD